MASRAHRLWRTAAIVLASAFLLVVWPGGNARPGASQQRQTHSAPAVHRCEEDEECWDCSTMGNRGCGPVEEGTR